MEADSRQIRKACSSRRLAAPVAWTVPGVMLVVDLLGEFMLVDEAVLRISPFVTTSLDLHNALAALPRRAWTQAYQARRPRAAETGVQIQPRDGARHGHGTVAPR